MEEQSLSGLGKLGVMLALANYCVQMNDEGIYDCKRVSALLVEVLQEKLPNREQLCRVIVLRNHLIPAVEPHYLLINLDEFSDSA